MTFLAVTHAADIEVDEFSGIIGLSPANTQALGHKELDEFIGRMKFVTGKQKIKPIFSFYLTNVDKREGSMQIGGFNLKKYAKPGLTEKDIIWHSLQKNSDYFWTMSLAKVRFSGGRISINKDAKGRSIFKNEIPLAGNSLILDTGMSFGMAPMADLINIVKFLWENYKLKCDSVINGDNVVVSYKCDCKNHTLEDLPTIEVYLLTNLSINAGQFFGIAPEDWISIHENKTCNMLLKPSGLLSSKR